MRTREGGFVRARARTFTRQGRIVGRGRVRRCVRVYVCVGVCVCVEDHVECGPSAQKGHEGARAWQKKGVRSAPMPKRTHERASLEAGSAVRVIGCEEEEEEEMDTRPLPSSAPFPSSSSHDEDVPPTPTTGRALLGGRW